MHALIADDDRGTTAILSSALRRWGIDITVAPDGNTAWDLLTSDHTLSLAIVDWMMPGLDGPELCRRIRREATLTHLYVILLTGRDSRLDVVAGLEAGADDYIVKPFDLDELRARVHVGLRVLGLQEELARLVRTDTLTGLSSRGRWLELAATEFDRYQRYHHSLGILMADLDFFKRVNDTFGHDAGDRVLKQFAEVMQQQCRQTDVVGRLGGEEFVVLLPDTPLQGGEQLAQRIVAACRTIAIPVDEGRITCTCSVGVAEATPADTSMEDVLRRADSTLYLAKRSGRDRWTSDLTPSSAHVEPGEPSVAQIT